MSLPTFNWWWISVCADNGKSLNRLPATDAAMLVQNITEQLENISEELVHKVEVCSLEIFLHSDVL